MKFLLHDFFPVLFRFVSLILVVAALMLLGADAVTSLEKGGQIYVRSLETVWALFDKGAVDAFKAWNMANLPGFLSQGIAVVLRFPGWSVTGVIGFILAFVFGRRYEYE